MPAVDAGGAVLVVGAGEDCVSSDDCGRSSLPDMFFFFFLKNHRDHIDLILGSSGFW